MRSIQPERTGQAEYKRQDWVVDAESGTSIQDCQDPQYWAHVCQQFKIFDRIEVRVESGEWMAEFVVLACERNWAKVEMLHFYDLAPADKAPVSAKYEVTWKGPHLKWSVIRIADREKIKDKMMSREEADSWLRQYEDQVTA